MIGCFLLVPVDLGVFPDSRALGYNMSCVYLFMYIYIYILVFHFC